MTASGHELTRPVSAYAAIGATLVNFTVDVKSAELTRRGEIALQARVQYAWPHATLPILYVACADRTASAQVFCLCALMRDDVGDLSLHGAPVALPSRPINVTTDAPSAHVLTAYTGAPGLTVHAIRPDGTIGDEVPRAAPFDPGSAPHQVRVTPSNARAILVARGKKGFGGPSYVAGALKLVRFDQGCVENVGELTVEPPQMPDGFNPRQVDFHPTLPLAFVSLEGQNQLTVFRMTGDGFDPAPLFTREILAHPEAVQPRQDAGAVRVHPNGGYVYIANRNDGYVGGQTGPTWLSPDPIPVFPGGENSIAVFQIDLATGEPTLIQHADSRGLHPREFALDPTGRLLVAGNQAPTILKDGDDLSEVPANLAVFRIADDGRLEFVRRYPLEVGSEMVMWTGVVG